MNSIWVHSDLRVSILLQRLVLPTTQRSCVVQRCDDPPDLDIVCTAGRRLYDCRYPYPRDKYIRSVSDAASGLAR